MPELRKEEKETKRHNRIIIIIKLTSVAARSKLDPWETCITDVEGCFGKIRSHRKGQRKKEYNGMWGPENRKLTQDSFFPRRVCQGPGKSQSYTHPG